jgi:hypothetical protein
MRDVGVAVFRVLESGDPDVGVAFVSFVGADIGAGLELLDDVDLLLEGGEGVFDGFDFGGIGSGFEFESDEVTERCIGSEGRRRKEGEEKEEGEGDAVHRAEMMWLPGKAGKAGVPLLRRVRPSFGDLWVLSCIS